MARARNPNRDKAREIWLASNGTKKLKDIAEELGCSDSQIRKWKSQDNWDSEIKSNASKGNSNVTNETERYQSAKGNDNAKGNDGGAPPENKNAVSHGLFAKWLPDDTKELLQEIYTSTPADIIWNNIMIQYTAIIRSQRIMFVNDELDTTSNVTEVVLEPTLVDTKTNMPVKRSEKREYHYAWEKQANFLSAQSRAMGTLSNLIKQFVALADELDERRLKLKLMQANIDKLSDGGKQQDGIEWAEMVVEAEKELGEFDE